MSSDAQTRKQYTSYVENPSEAIGVPDSARYSLDIEDARRILRLSEVVRANVADGLYTIEVFDRRVDWLRGGISQKDRKDEYGMAVEGGGLKIDASHCRFTGNFDGAEIMTKSLPLADLAADFDLTDEFPRYQRRSPGPR